MFGQKKLIIISNQETFARFIEDCKGQDKIAVDLESNSLHAYQERICLFQISTYHYDYILDPLSLDDLSPFLALLQDWQFVLPEDLLETARNFARLAVSASAASTVCSTQS